MDKPRVTKPIHCESCTLYTSDRIALDGVMNPDIVFISDFPKDFDIKRGAFFNRSDGMVRSICREIERTAKAKVNKTFTYAVLCRPQEDNFKVYADTYTHCSGFLKTYLEMRKPKVIVTFGTEAMHSIDLKGTASQLRGGLYQYKFASGEEAVVIPSYTTYQVLKQPGLVSVMETDIRKAYTLILENTTEADFELLTPTTAEEN